MKIDAIRKTVFIFFISILSICFSTAELFPFIERRGIKFQHISIKHGLSQSTVFCILQDGKGFMWFGTLSGLNKYDGNNFTVYEPEPGDASSLSHRAVRCIYEDRSGTLWIGTWGGLNKFDRKKETFTSYRNEQGNPNSLGDDRVRAILEDKSGRLWIGAIGGGLNLFDRQTATFTRYQNDAQNPLSLSDNNINSIYEDRAGNLWIGTRYGLNKMDRQTGTFTRYMNRFEGAVHRSYNFIMDIREDASGMLWVATWDAGLFAFNPHTGIFTGCRVDSGNPDSIGSNSISGICMAGNEGIWVATWGGLNFFDIKTRTFTTYRHRLEDPASLCNDFLQSVYIDRAGLLWVGARRGINKSDGKKAAFVHYRSIPGNANSLSHNSIFSIREDRSGDLWVGTLFRGLNKLDRENNRVTRYLNANVTPGARSIRELYEDRSGTLWVGTTDGLNRFNRQDQRFTCFRNQPENPASISHNFVAVIMEDRAGILWVGTAGGLNIFHKENNTFTRFLHEPGNPAGLSHDFITAICEDRTGMLWVGTAQAGLNIFNRATRTFSHYRFQSNQTHSLNSDEIISIYEDSGGVMWVGTAEGLNKFDRQDESFTSYTTRDGLPDNTVYGILEDKKGNLWFSTNKGICRFNPSAMTFKNYGPEDGLQDYEFNAGACHKNKKGEMFFGGVNGLNSFFPDKIEDNTCIPPVVITRFNVFNRPSVTALNDDATGHKNISETKKITLSYRDNIFSFQFAALDYAAPGKNQYQYMMEGFTEGWIHLGNKHDITFTNLDPGRYTFRVRGSNNDGIWNKKGTSIIIVIRPPYWKTWWFRILITMAIILAALAWHRRRMQNLRLRLKTETEMERIFAKYNISQREQEIINLMLRGKSNKDIEDTLYISIKTVKSHVYNIYQKFGVKNRLELISQIQASLKS
jgi:ligand-binding sensor domain-containing protein/DNA-binding CsgD family transcriptional regulator